MFVAVVLEGSHEVCLAGSPSKSYFSSQVLHSQLSFSYGTIPHSALVPSKTRSPCTS